MPAPPPTPTRAVPIGSEGLRLGVWRSGEAGPSIVFVHGFPDTHTVWDAVIARLSDRFRCIAYDVRGAGASDAPPTREGYRLSHLVTDLVAVLDSQSPDEPAHLVAHDWGSIQAWDAVVRESSDNRLQGRIASYTSISGPSLHHVDAYVGAARRGGWQRKRQALGQLRHSWYVYAFHLPVLPELFLRASSALLLRRSGGRRPHVADTLPRDAVNGLELYRANVFHREPVPGGPRTSLPVQLVVPLRDRYVTPSLLRDVHRFAADLTRVEVDAGHWVARSHPDELASYVDGFVTGSTT